MKKIDCYLLILHKVREPQDKEVRDDLVRLFDGKMVKNFREPYESILEYDDMIPDCWVYEGKISFKMVFPRGRRKIKRRINIHTATTAEYYRRLWKDCPHHVVLLDLFLPEYESSRPRKETGIRLLQEIKRDHPETEVIVLVDEEVSEWTLEVIEKGAFFFVKKPFVSLGLVKVLVARILQMIEGSFRDPLTGLYNRRYFEITLINLWNEYRRRTSRHQDRKGKNSISKIIIDLDDFKLINDTYSHSEGDKALKFIASKIRKRFRPNDTKARIGGDEFGVIAPNMDHERALERAEKLRKEVENTPVKLKKKSVEEKVKLTISIGVATYRNPNDVSSAPKFEECAFDALYGAKGISKSRKKVKRKHKNIVFGYTEDGDIAKYSDIFKETSKSEN
ncbi:MAG: GGDEF domain-containing response regulator [Gemmatimonadota bacterium]|nr:MAG: GGDEF domain-containing response regulator [Gemmatimonadota bacterium]